MWSGRGAAAPPRTDEFLLFVAVGFAAPLVDGALGMAYGVTATTVLLSLGLAPAPASASVHAAEVVTTGVSGLAHWGFGNIDCRLFRGLVVPGMLRGGLGAYLLTALPGEAVRARSPAPTCSPWGP